LNTEYSKRLMSPVAKQFCDPDAPEEAADKPASQAEPARMLTQSLAIRVTVPLFFLRFLKNI